MKVRNLTAIAVVATGAIALGAPAAFAQAPDVSGVNGGLDKLGAIGKSAKKQARAAHHSSFQKRTGEDIKRLGDNVRDLRKRDDEITNTISSVVATVTPILTQLGAAAQSYANFQYGFVQLTITGVGGPPTYFTVTPRLDPTSAQSTVSRQFVMPAALPTALPLGAEVGVRSLNSPTALDNESTAYCSATVSDSSSTLTSKSNPDAKNLPFYPIQRSTLIPADPADNVTSLVGAVTGDKTVNLLATSRNATGGTITVSAGETVTVSLSCMAIPNSSLKTAGITPPFAS